MSIEGEMLQREDLSAILEELRSTRARQQHDSESREFKKQMRSAAATAKNQLPVCVIYVYCAEKKHVLVKIKFC